MSTKNQKLFRVFVNSTYIDLIDYRKAAEKAINDQRQKYEGMECLSAMDKEPTKACLDLVEKCDLFIGIYAWRYGSISEDSSISITEQEYNHAIKLCIPCLCYFVDEDFAWPPKLIEKDSAADKLELFKNKVSNKHIRGSFKETIHLERNIISDLSNWLADNRPELKKEALKPGQNPVAMYEKAIAEKYATLPKDQRLNNFPIYFYLNQFSLNIRFYVLHLLFRGIEPCNFIYHL